MIRIAGAPFALLVFVVASAFAKSTAPEVIFISPCECQGFHGKNRWIVKTDFTPVPLFRRLDVRHPCEQSQLPQAVLARD
jgi:hypothetical protein